VCLCVCITLSALVLHTASGKFFLGQTYHSHKCGHHRLAGHGRKPDTEAHAQSHTQSHTYACPSHTHTVTCKICNTQRIAHRLTVLMGSSINAENLIGRHVKGQTADRDVGCVQIVKPSEANV